MLSLPKRRESPLSVRFSTLSVLISLLGSGIGQAVAAPKRAPKNAAAKSVAVPAKPAPLLDTATVRRYYLDGDFEPAIGILETTLATKKSGLTHEDSVFIFKHLGVMYAAKYDTREKGKHYMLKLLEAEPTARILDMYASDMIYMIFKNIQDEFEAARRKLDRVDSLRVAGEPRKHAAEPGPKEPAKKGGSGLVWLGAGAAVAVAAGAATWYYFSDEPVTRVQDHNPNLGN